MWLTEGERKGVCLRVLMCTVAACVLIRPITLPSVGLKLLLGLVMESCLKEKIVDI